MKKLFIGLALLFSFLNATPIKVQAQIAPISFIKNTWDADASSYLSHFTDMPINGKLAVNKLFLDLKFYGLWSQLKYAFIAPLTMDETEAYRDIKSNTVLATAPLNGDLATVCYPIGYYFSHAGDYINTGVSLNTLGVTTTSTCVIWGEKTNQVGASVFEWGALQSAGQRVLTQIRPATNVSLGVLYGDNGLTSRVTSSGTTDKSGIWGLNRTSSTFLELLRNGTQLSTNTFNYASAAITTINTYVGAFNNLGTAATFSIGTRDFWAVFNGLSATDRTNAYTCFLNFRTNMNRPAAITQQIVLDGNSLGVRQKQRLFRRSLFDLGLNNVSPKNISAAGQTTTTKLSRYASTVRPLYDATLSKNIYCLLEIGNDLYAGASVATAKTNVQRLIDSANTQGYITVLVVPWLRTYVGNTGRTETNWNLDFDNLMQWARVAANSGADYVVNITNSNLTADRSSYASDALFNTAASTICANGTYYVDGTHLTNAGYDIVGAIMSLLFASIL